MNKLSELQDDLIDPVSFELFDAQANKPITLPCGHNISEKTLRVTYNYKIANCPLCRKKIAPDLELHPNIALINFLRIYHTQVKNSTFCLDHPTHEVQGICLSCNKLLCFDCLMDGTHAGHEKTSTDKYLGKMDQKISAVEDSLTKCQLKLKTERDHIHQQLNPVFEELEHVIYETSCERLIKWQKEAVLFVTKLKEIRQKKRGIQFIEKDVEEIISSQGDSSRSYTDKKLQKIINIIKAISVDDNIELSPEKKLATPNQSPEKMGKVLVEPVKIQTFMDWLKEADAKCNKLDIIWLDKDSRYVQANADIEEGEEILVIPDSHSMSLEMAYNTGMSKAIYNSKIEILSPKHTHLAALMLEEKHNPDSFWKPYLDVLPQECRTFPVNFTDDELKELTGSPLVQKIEARKRDLLADYNAVVKAVPEFAKFSFEEFKWARLNVSSRVYGLTIRGNKTDLMVPFADIMNHSYKRKTSWYYSEKHNGFIVVATAKIAAREQVTSYFGRKCNSRFLLNYGFMVPENEAYNTFLIRVPFDQNDSYLPVKRTLLGSNNKYDYKEFNIYASIDEEENLQMIGFLRFVLAKDSDYLEELNKIKKSFGNNEEFEPTKSPPFSLELEKEVILAYEKLVKESLAKYPTTIEEDKLLLEQHLTKNVRNCVLFRMGEKEVLLSNLKFIETTLKYLDEFGCADINMEPYLRYKNYYLNLKVRLNRIKKNKEASKKLVSEDTDISDLFKAVDEF